MIKGEKREKSRLDKQKRETCKRKLEIHEDKNREKVSLGYIAGLCVNFEMIACV